jgi:hypothetical protein
MFSTENEMKDAPTSDNQPHLSLAPNTSDTIRRLTRAQVAERIGASVPTVRRHEGTLLHPHVDEKGVHWFDPKEVTALAASRANNALARGSLRSAKPVPETRTRGELAALVFERFEQRQSQAEIVIGLRVEPEIVRELFDQYCRGLVEIQLDKKHPNVQLEAEIEKVHRDELVRRLEALPEGQTTRISVARWRGPGLAGEDPADYASIVELGGFLVSGPCATSEITRRYGPGSYRVTSFGFDPPGLRWELFIRDLRA